MPAECKIPRFVQFLGKESAAETNKTPGELPGFNKNLLFGFELLFTGCCSIFILSDIIILNELIHVYNKHSI